MGILSRMRRGAEKLISWDYDEGRITRPVRADNGRGQTAPAGEYETLPPLRCRVSYQSGGVWPSKSDEAGLTIDKTPYVLAPWDADIRMGDILEWRGKRYTLGPVSRPQAGGGSVCAQAPLTEAEQWLTE